MPLAGPQKILLVNSRMLVVFLGGFLKEKSPCKNWVKWDL
jgi:hypothetical protein